MEPPISPADAHSQVPFGPYLLFNRLALGGMAELFLAKDTRNHRFVVLKRILPYLAKDAEFLGMFLDEARVAASLHHPNIVELYDLGHLEDTTFIAMEWVEGIDLRRVLKKEQLRGGVVPPGIAAWCAARLCEGLHHAHFAQDAAGNALGIIHRDVSPPNVMLSYKGEVKLVDFGIAKVTAWVSRSKPGVIKGKFLYLSPEQLTGEAIDHRADIFSMGSLLYELTTGKSPFYRGSTEDVIGAIRSEEAAPPERVRDGFPPTLARIILKCLAKNRALRYQTADEVRADLEEFIKHEAPTSRQSVVGYVSTLFADDQERTVLEAPSEQKAVPGRTHDEEEGTNPWDPEVTAPIPHDFHEREAAESVPDAMILSAGERTQGILDTQLADALDRHSTTSNAPPTPPTQSNVRRRPQKNIKDPDDDVGTMAIRSAPIFQAVAARQNRLSWFRWAIGAGVSIAVLFLVIWFWPADDSKLVRVQIQAAQGTALTVNGKAILPGEGFEWSPGDLVVEYTCPGKPKEEGGYLLRARIPPSRALVVVDIPCR